MKSKQQILEKINEYYKLPRNQKYNPRNIGFVDALRWVYEDNDNDAWNKKS